MSKKKVSNNSLPKPAFTVRSLKLTEKQKSLLFLSLDNKSKIVFINGPAGSSKTYMGIYSALNLLRNNTDLDLLYVRTIIESADRNMGALPGDAEEKFNPYMSPLIDKLNEMLAPSVVKSLLLKHKIQAMPINFLRGASWVDKIVVADEAQNFTFKELITLITRLGEGSKLFICGDIMQSDIHTKSGFANMINIFNDKESEDQGIFNFKFGKSDIKRSELLKYIVEKLENYSNP